MNKGAFDLLLASALVVIAACGEGQTVQEPSANGPGELTLQIVAGPEHLGGFTAQLTAPLDRTLAYRCAEEGYQVLHRFVSDHEIRVLVLGRLEPGIVLTVNVSDVQDSALYDVQLLEVSDSTGTLEPVTDHHVAFTASKRHCP